METDLVQIHANKEELMGRINAFCQRKREHINEANVKTFCGLKGPHIENASEYSSCARVDAIHFSIHNKSRFPVSSVINKEGPQLKPRPSQEQPSPKDTDFGPNMKERVENMERHCNLLIDTDLSLVERVKKLEDRILYLEGTSLEYFNHNQQHATDITDLDNVDMTAECIPTPSSGLLSEEPSIAQVDNKIKELKDRLKKKALELG
ncbi:MAP3K12-binding inhibitory protein 1-like [Watersipora subatra]|uniref:MAP3K12-binding inhibitory protein 1-like n=1 Tax=Watersipora subatra TaxID=2589382 RepID=UPI00355BC238